MSHVDNTVVRRGYLTVHRNATGRVSDKGSGAAGWEGKEKEGERDEGLSACGSKTWVEG